ncbi:MAG: DNA-binding MarR family transcriptional regulator [Bacillariaceae sp.]|jgi:DNA-binding MarR family transcriptional regulator
MHSAYLKKQRKSCKERSKVVDKIIKTIEERGYFVRYFESTNQIRQEISKALNNLGYYIE